MKTFYNLLVNTVIATITNMTVWFALIFFAYLQTQSVLSTSITSGIFLLTVAVTGFWFGNIVDHTKKKTVMLASGFVSLVVYLIGFIVYIAVGADAFKNVSSPALWAFIILLLIGVIVSNIRGIALPTIITLLVSEKDRDKANGMAGMATGAAFLVVSVISAFLVGYSGMFHVLLLGIFANLLTLIHLWFIKIPENKIVHIEGHESTKLDIPATFKIINSVPGLFALILFATINNFLGGVFMSLMDAYALSLVSVQTWGLLFGVLSTSFIIGGFIISKWGLGKNPLKALFLANIAIWVISIFFTIQPWIWLLAVGMFMYMSVIPYIEAAEHTIIQKVVEPQKQGRVFGFSQSVEQMASPLTAFLIGPIAQFFFIPLMSEGGAGAELIGSWYGVGMNRGLAIVFTLTGIIGLAMTIGAMNSKYYKLLSYRYLEKKA